MHKGAVYIIFILLGALLFVFVDQYIAILIWLFFYFLGVEISNKLYKVIPSKTYFSKFYFIFSFLGLIILFDNYYNFNVLTGFAGDDEKFLQGTKYLIGQASKPNLELSFFSYVLTIIAYPVSLVKEVSLADLIAFNWFLAALIGVLINKLSYLLTSKNIPFFLFALAYPFQFIMTDTFTRLYRDNLLIFFLLIGTLEIYRNRSKLTIFSIIPIALLRMANVSFFAFVFLFKKIKFKKIKWILLSLLGLSIVFISFLPGLVKFAMIYGSDISRTERYESAFSKLDSEEVIESRFSEAQATENSLMAAAYSETSFKAISIRAIFSYFFPLSLRNPDSAMTHSNIGTVRGFYFYYIINWINTLSLIIVFPLLSLGIILNKNFNINILIGSTLLYLLLVLLISGQGRHTITAYIFNAIFAANGFYILKNNKRFKGIFFGLVSVSFLIILGYNLM